MEQCYDTVSDRSFVQCKQGGFIMIHNARLFIVLVIVAICGAGCTNINYSKEHIGHVVGPTLDGSVVYLAGKSISKSMDDEDQRRLLSATDTGLRKDIGQTYSDRWLNDNRVYETRVTPKGAYIRGSDWQHCKNFTQDTSVIIDRKREIAQQNCAACYDQSKGWVIQPQ